MMQIKKVHKKLNCCTIKTFKQFLESTRYTINDCEESLTLSWSTNCVITSLETRLVTAAQGDNPEVHDDSPTGAKFKITDTKLYVLVVTLSAENDNKFLEQLKTGSKRTITRNKYRSEMSNQTINKNLNYSIDPTLANVNRLFVLSYENETDRTSLSKYYVPKVEIKDFNVLIDGYHFLKFL